MSIYTYRQKNFDAKALQVESIFEKAQNEGISQFEVSFLYPEIAEQIAQSGFFDVKIPTFSEVLKGV